MNLKTDKLEQKIADSRLSLEVAKLDLAVAKVEHSFATNNATLDKTAAVRALARLEEDFERYEQKTKVFSEKSAKFSLTSSENSLSYIKEELKQLRKMYEADDITEETEEIIIKRAQHAVDRSLHYLERSRNSTEAALMFSLPREHVDMKDALTRKQLVTGKSNDTHREKLNTLKLGLSKQIIDLKRAEKALAKLEGDLLFCCNQDVTGVVGWMGSLLADANINIADMALGREKPGGRAIMVFNIDEAITSEVLAKIEADPLVLWAKQVEL